MSPLDDSLFLPILPPARYHGESSALNMALAASADWPKETLDFPEEALQSAETFRAFLTSIGESVQHFKSMPGYTAALASGRYPWLEALDG